MYSYNPYYEKYLAHYGVKHKSGRYPWGSGDRPYQGDGVKLKKRYAKSTSKYLYSRAGLKNYEDYKDGVLSKDEYIKRSKEINRLQKQDLKNIRRNNEGLSKKDFIDYTSKAWRRTNNMFTYDPLYNVQQATEKYKNHPENIKKAIDTILNKVDENLTVKELGTERQRLDWESRYKNEKEFESDKSYKVNDGHATRKVGQCDINFNVNSEFQSISANEYKKYADNLIKNFDTINRNASKQIAVSLVNDGINDGMTEKELQNRLYKSGPFNIYVTPDKLGEISYGDDTIAGGHILSLEFTGDNYKMREHVSLNG